MRDPDEKRAISEGGMTALYTFDEALAEIVRLGVVCEALSPAQETLSKGPWLVARKRDTEPWEVCWFDRYDEAAMHFDAVQTNWSTVFFCQVAHCEGQPLDVTPVIHQFKTRAELAEAQLAAQIALFQTLREQIEQLPSAVWKQTLNDTDGPDRGVLLEGELSSLFVPEPEERLVRLADVLALLDPSSAVIAETTEKDVRPNGAPETTNKDAARAASPPYLEDDGETEVRLTQRLRDSLYKAAISSLQSFVNAHGPTLANGLLDSAGKRVGTAIFGLLKTHPDIRRTHPQRRWVDPICEAECAKRAVIIADLKARIAELSQASSGAERAGPADGVSGPRADDTNRNPSGFDEGPQSTGER